MEVWAIVLSCVDIVLCIAIIVLVAFQQGNDEGMGVLGGGSGADTFFGKEKGRTMDEKLKKITQLIVVLFAVVSVALYLILSNGF